MLCFLATEAHELSLSTSLSVLYFSAIDFEVNFHLRAIWHHPSNILRSVHTHSKKALQFLQKCADFFLSPILVVIVLKSYLSESFLLMGPKKSVLLSKIPTYLGSQLSEVFLV